MQQYSPEHIQNQLQINLMFWGYVIVSKLFYKKYPDFHKEIIYAITKFPKVAIAAPRGHAKSSIVSFLYVLHSICYGSRNFIAIFSSTKDKASSHFKGVREQLEENKILHTFYGKPTFKKLTEYEMVVQFPDKDSIRLVSWGQEQMEIIRGEKHNGRRPDLIILDDCEYQELVDSPERRRKLKQAFDEALLPSGEHGRTQYIAVGTILHFDALIAQLTDQAKYTDWYKMFYETSVEAPLWEEMVPATYLEKIKQDSPLVYAKEYQNNPISGENATFNPESFRYWESENNGYRLLDKYNNVLSKGQFKGCVPAIACDLAWSTRKTADETAIVSALLTPDNYIIVYSLTHERGMRPERFNEYLFEQVKHLHSLTGSRPCVGLEKAMLERVTQHLLKTEMTRRNEFFIIKPLKWESDKISRITVSLEARYANNTIFHKRGMGYLEDQLIQFPYAAFDDCIDAEAGVVALLKYPKTLKGVGVSSDDPMFDWVRNNMLPSRQKKDNNTLGQFLLGGGMEGRTVKAKKSFMAKE